MSVPPKYDDLGKESRDVFGKGYGKTEPNVRAVGNCQLSIELACHFW